MEKILFDKLNAMIYGVAVGDALGSPVQFVERKLVKKNPVTDMTDGGIYHKKAGTWTDDTSMSLCLLSSLGEKGEIDYEDVMQKFIDWMFKNKYTPNEKAFDIGRTCASAIFKKREGVPATQCGGKTEHENGNGSLMRISPIVFYINSMFGSDAFDGDEAFFIVHNTSSLTHAHYATLLGCDIFVSILLELLNGCTKEEARIKALPRLGKFLNRHPEYCTEIERYNRIIHMTPKNLTELEEEEIKSTGYVVDTLEAALWSFLTTDSYKECLLKAVNLGHDADSVGAVAGALAGLYYCNDEERKIPEDWLKKVRGKDMIDELLEKYSRKF